jgi:two-component system response regulator FlrC
MEAGIQAMEVPAGDAVAEAPIAADMRSREVFDLASRVARSEVTVMITGESGTGKEVLARYIHAESGRAHAPFAAINCAAIPETMLEAELFGHEKGAFTGAVEARAGRFELAGGGTLLLDEISEMPLGLQAKLLRVLQEREFERLGGRRTINLEARVIATSNRNLRAEVEAGRFREDLYYRLNVFPIHLPPLRERRADILPIARSLLARHGAGKIALPPAAERLLQEHAWPGNVRELDNVIQRALILMAGGKIQALDIRLERCVEAGPDTSRQDAGVLEYQLRQHEQQLILDAVRRGSRRDAAAELGISPRTLRHKLAQLREAGVEIPRSVRQG